jgi:hypothetical protein
VQLVAKMFVVEAKAHGIVLADICFFLVAM